ncbi:protein translocase subunit secF [Fictibacillus enclensis]|nr:protein translocase subunit secF [Fictibacillus enclensis]
MSFNYDFVKHRKIFFIFSSIITVLGIVSLLVFGLNLGIDYESGSKAEVQAKTSINAEDLSDTLNSVGLKPEEIPVLAGQNNQRASVAYNKVLSKDEIAKFKTTIKDKYGTEPSVSTVSPVVGRELARNALISVLIASVGIIIYVGLRFEFLMALAAIIALLHDAFMIIAVFSFLRLEVDLTFIAAVLTIVGYSINDTIVTFDRIRENMKKTRIKNKDVLAGVVHDSIKQTLTRSINTVLTVLVAAVALWIFGSESIRNFSIALFIGLMFGMYSSICIASQLWFVWKAKQLKKRNFKPADSQA